MKTLHPCCCFDKGTCSMLSRCFIVVGSSSVILGLVKTDSWGVGVFCLLNVKKKNRAKDCWFCYLGNCGQDGWKCHQFNPCNLVPVLFSAADVTCTGVRLLPSQELGRTEYGFTWRWPQKPDSLIVCRRTYYIDHRLLRDVNSTCGISVMFRHLHHLIIHVAYVLFCFRQGLCVSRVQSDWRKHPFSEGTYVCAWWLDQSHSWCQWDWMLVYFRPSTNRNGFVLKCLGVMKNEMVCSIACCMLFRGLEDNFFTLC